MRGNCRISVLGVLLNEHTCFLGLEIKLYNLLVPCAVRLQGLGKSSCILQTARVSLVFSVTEYLLSHIGLTFL